MEIRVGLLLVLGNELRVRRAACDFTSGYSDARHIVLSRGWRFNGAIEVHTCTHGVIYLRI
jgi:hypothetical protein